MRLCFTYDHEYRLVDVERVWTSKSGDHLISGPDHARGDEYRTFRCDRIKDSRVKVVHVRGYTPVTVDEFLEVYLR